MNILVQPPLATKQKTIFSNLGADHGNAIEDPQVTRITIYSYYFAVNMKNSLIQKRVQRLVTWSTIT